MNALAWVAVILVGVPVVYTAVAVVYFRYVSFPDDHPFVVLEDLFLLVATPFLAALIGVILLRRGRLR